MKAKKPSIHASNAQGPHSRHQLMRVDLDNVLYEGLRIGGRGRQMNLNIKDRTNKVKLEMFIRTKPMFTSKISMCVWPALPGSFL
jgi:hypothetical protein